MRLGHFFRCGHSCVVRLGAAERPFCNHPVSECDLHFPEVVRRRANKAVQRTLDPLLGCPLSLHVSLVFNGLRL